MKIFINPNEEVCIEDELRKKIGQLNGLPMRSGAFFMVPCENTLDSIIWILACFYSGITAAPIPALMANIQPYIDALGAQSVFTERDLPSAPPTTEALSLRNQERTWAVIFSSGTTGNPKAIALSGTALKLAAEAHQKHLNFSGLWLLNMPLYHVGGFNILTRALFLNQDIGICGSKFNIEETSRWISSGVVAGLSLVPTVLYRLLKNNVRAHANLKVLLLGGAPADPPLVETAMKLGFPILRTYGMSESCSQVATEKKSLDGMIPLPGMEIKIGHDQEIMIRAPYLGSGYFVNGQLQPFAINNEYFATGDLGEFKDRLSIFGRKNELIISGGLNIFPQEIEIHFQSNTFLDDFAVFGVADKEWGEVVCAAYVTKRALDPSELRNYLQTRLDPRKIPKYWVALDKIPRTNTGKVKRQELRAFFEKSF